MDGKLIKRRCEEKGITLTELAKMIGCSRESLSRYVNNHVKRMNHDIICKICKILSIDEDDEVDKEDK